MATKKEMGTKNEQALQTILRLKKNEECTVEVIQDATIPCTLEVKKGRKDYGYAFICKGELQRQGFWKDEKQIRDWFKKVL